MAYRQNGTAMALARGLGWFSIGLGLAELAAPESVARLIGVPATRDTTSTLRAFGARMTRNHLATAEPVNRRAPTPGDEPYGGRKCSCTRLRHESARS